MARIIPINELINAEESTGWLETIWINEDGTKRESTLEAIAYDNEDYSSLAGTGYWKHIEHSYNKIIKRSHKDYLEYADDDDTTLQSGFRVWDSKPTQDEMKSTDWLKQTESVVIK